VASLPLAGLLQLLCEAATDLVEDQADQGLGAADVRGRDDQIQESGRSASIRSAMRQSQREVTSATVGSR
jgi:hypothetical protein